MTVNVLQFWDWLCNHRATCSSWREGLPRSSLGTESQGSYCEDREGSPCGEGKGLGGVVAVGFDDPV